MARTNAFITCSVLIILYFQSIVGDPNINGRSNIASSGEISREIKDMVIYKVQIGSNPTLYRLSLTTWFSGVLLFSKQACNTMTKPAHRLGLSMFSRQNKDDNVKKMCETIQLYDDTQEGDVSSKEDFQETFVQGIKVKGYTTTKNLKIDDYVMEKQDVGIVTHLDPNIARNNLDGHFDGFFGIRFLKTDKSNQVVESNFFRSLSDTTKITEKLFGLYLNSVKPEGELRLGGLNNNYILNGKSSLKGIPLESGGSKGWLIKISSVKVGANEVAKDVMAYVDPSTNNFGGKQELIAKINQAIGVSGPATEGIYMLSSCNGNKEITFEINGAKFPIDESNYRLMVADTSNICGSLFIELDLSEYDLILGSPFLKKYYSVFDIQEKKISFAEAVRPKI